MLDFTTELLTRPHQTEPAARGGPVERSLAERRSTATIKSTAPAAPRRRRNDALNYAIQARLQW